MRNIFITTQNVKRFSTVMKEAQKSIDPALVAIQGQVGRGKTTAARFYAAREGWVYCRAKTLWSDLWMLQDLCSELGVDPIPKRKKPAFEAIVERLNGVKKVILIDEMDKVQQRTLEVIRDMADMTLAPFVLLGEKLLIHKMQRERRIWSRTIRAVEFGPISTQDILFFAKESADLTLTVGQGERFRVASDGDFRLIKRDVGMLEELKNANDPGGNGRIADKLVESAIRSGFRGK